MNNLSVYLGVTRRGLNQGGCCHVFSTRGRGVWGCVCVCVWGGCQGGDGPLFRQSCPAELSPRPQPGAWRRVSESSFLSDAPTEMISHDL